MAESVLVSAIGIISLAFAVRLVRSLGRLRAEAAEGRKCLDMRDRVLVFLASYVVSIVAGGVVSTSVCGMCARMYVRRRVGALARDHGKVTLNNVQLKDAVAVADEIITMYGGAGHHSWPVNKALLQFTSQEGESLTLELGQDSTNVNEVWVYWRPYSTSVELGRVNSISLGEQLRNYDSPPHAC